MLAQARQHPTLAPLICLTLPARRRGGCRVGGAPEPGVGPWRRRGRGCEHARAGDAAGERAAAAQDQLQAAVGARRPRLRRAACRCVAACAVRRGCAVALIVLCCMKRPAAGGDGAPAAPRRLHAYATFNRLRPLPAGCRTPSACWAHCAPSWRTPAWTPMSSSAGARTWTSCPPAPPRARRCPFCSSRCGECTPQDDSRAASWHALRSFGFQLRTSCSTGQRSRGRCPAWPGSRRSGRRGGPLLTCRARTHAVWLGLAALQPWRQDLAAGGQVSNWRRCDGAAPALQVHCPV